MVAENSLTNLTQPLHSNALQLCYPNHKKSQCVYNSPDVSHCHSTWSWWG